jgi:hypothetical protein
MKLEVGEITDSGNFQLIERIRSLDELWTVLVTEKSVFVRHKAYPTAFIMSWTLRHTVNWINQGMFFKIKRILK